MKPIKFFQIIEVKGQNDTNISSQKNTEISIQLISKNNDRKQPK